MVTSTYFRYFRVFSHLSSAKLYQPCHPWFWFQTCSRLVRISFSEDRDRWTREITWFTTVSWWPALTANERATGAKIAYLNWPEIKRLVILATSTNGLVSRIRLLKLIMFSNSNYRTDQRGQHIAPQYFNHQQQQHQVHWPNQFSQNLTGHHQSNDFDFVRPYPVPPRMANKRNSNGESTNSNGLHTPPGPSQESDSFAPLTGDEYAALEKSFEKEFGGRVSDR